MQWTNYMVKFESSSKPTIINADPSDVSTLDGIIKAFYESISFSSGSQPNFRRFRTLFHPRGMLVPSKVDKMLPQSAMDIDSFIKNSVENIVLTGMERKGSIIGEIARRTLTFGNITHIFSTFETKNKYDDPKAQQRGVYSIQMIKDNHRWWVISLIWETERQDMPLPKAYLV